MASLSDQIGIADLPHGFTHFFARFSNVLDRIYEFWMVHLRVDAYCMGKVIWPNGNGGGDFVGCNFLGVFEPFNSLDLG